MCENSTLGGYTDWRLPDKDELMSMYTNKDYIGGFTTGSYWSSSNYYYSSYSYYYVSFYDGYISYDKNSYNKSGRCVRTINKE